MLTGVSLEPNLKYIFYTKAWYSNTEYAVYVSDGIYTATLPPELSIAWKVEETRTSTSHEDIDYTTQTDQVSLLWENVFRDGQAGIRNYTVMVGRHPGLGDVASDVFDADTTRTTFINLTVTTNQKYFTTVEACSFADLCTTTISDGFLVCIYILLLGQR